MQLTGSRLVGNDPFTMLEVVTNRIIESEHDAVSKHKTMSRLFKSIQATATVSPDIHLSLMNQTISNHLEECNVCVNSWYFATESRQGYTLHLSRLNEEASENFGNGEAHLHVIKSKKFGIKLFASIKYQNPLTVKSKRLQRVKSSVAAQISSMLTELGYVVDSSSKSMAIGRLLSLDSVVENDTEHKTSRVIDLRIGASRQDAERIAADLSADYKQTRIVKTSSRYTIAGLDKK